MEYVERLFEGRIVASLDTARGVCLLGARQSGKRTLVTRLATARGMCVVTLDDDAERAAAKADPAGWLLATPTPVAIDEIQRVPELLLAIKQRIDGSNEAGPFLLTGSADPRTISRVRDALPGRLDYHVLHPLSRRELAGGTGSAVDKLFDAAPDGSSRWQPGIASYGAAIVEGGFPGALSRPDSDTRAAFFDGYLSSLIRRDLRDVERVRDADGVARLLSLVAARAGGLVNAASLARDVGTSSHTVTSWLGALSTMHLLTNVRSWHVNLGQREVKAPKAHVAESGVLAHLTGIDEHTFEVRTSKVGGLVETFVVGELVRQCGWASRIAGCYHARSRDGQEVDLVIERRDGSVIAVEVKAVVGVTASDARGLAWLRDRLGKRFVAGYVIHPGERTLTLGDRLWALPIAALEE